MISLTISKILHNKKLIKKLNQNIYYQIKYPPNKIMIVDDNLSFELIDNLLSLLKIKSIFTTLRSEDDLDNLIFKYSNNAGLISSEYLFFKVDNKDILKYGKIIKPNYILIGESEEIYDFLEIKSVLKKTTIISSSNHSFKDISYSLNDKMANFYISNIDYIRENITINKNITINVDETNEIYFKKIIMIFALFKTMNLDINVFNAMNKKSFSYENKKIFVDISKNSYNEAIRFASRYTDYKVLVIGWKDLCEDISWLYNAEFERLSNKNIQKIYCVGPNAFDIATRLKYASINEKLIIASANIDVFIKEINSYNLNIYILADNYYINFIKGA